MSARLTEEEAKKQWLCPITKFETHCIGSACPKWQQGPFTEFATTKTANAAYSPQYQAPDGDTFLKQSAESNHIHSLVDRPSMTGWILVRYQHHTGYNADAMTEQFWRKDIDADKGMCTVEVKG